MLYTAAPSTWPTGWKPTERTAANSSEVSADPQVPLLLISASRASAAGGKWLLTTPSVARLGQWRPYGSHGYRIERRYPREPGVSAPSLVLLVPGLVALPYLVQSVRRFLAGVVRAKEILARAGCVSGLYRHVTCAEPPLAVLVGVRHSY